MILDIHTHHQPPQQYGVISIDPSSATPHIPESQLFSIGIHPWNTEHLPSDECFSLMEDYLKRENAVAVGETGIDTLKGGPMFRQLEVFRRHVELSEKYSKPLIIHDVKAHDIIIGIHRDMKPSQRWLVHGFRGKKSVAEMLWRAGIDISFGEFFNPDTLIATPLDHIFSETDESSLSVFDVISRMETTIGKELQDQIALNISNFLNRKC